MSYFTKAHSLFAWTGFFCLFSFCVSFVLGPDYIVRLVGKTGMTGVFLVLLMAGLAASLSTGLIASIFEKQKGGDIDAEKGDVETAETKIA